MKKLLTSRLGLKNKALPILTVALVAVLCFAGQAAAGPVYTLDDSYWGGNNYYNPNNGDSIGGKPFTISDALVSRDGNQLTVIIETDYASHNGLENTYYGDLFLNPIWAASSRNNTNDPHYTADTYHPGDWSFAVHLLGDLGAPSGNATFYAITDANVVQSKVGSCTNSAGGPNNNGCGWYYRSHQAVSIDPANLVGTVAEIDKNATWSIVADKSITFTFDDQGKLGNNFALSWAMTCANDIIQGTVNLGPPLLGNPPSVPEPSTLLLAGVGLAGLGFTRRRRSVR